MALIWRFPFFRCSAELVHARARSDVCDRRSRPRTVVTDSLKIGISRMHTHVERGLVGWLCALAGFVTPKQLTVERLISVHLNFGASLSLARVRRCFSLICETVEDGGVRLQIKYEPSKFEREKRGKNT